MNESSPTTWERLRPWLRTIISIIVGVVGVWFVTRNVALNALTEALQTARWGLIALTFVVVMATAFLKACRWYFLFTPPLPRIPLRDLWHILCIGFFLNLLLPVARLGEISRIYLLDQRVRKAQVLGTLVVEKSIEMIMITITLFMALSLTILPTTINQPILFAAIAAVLFTTLYAIASQANLILKLVIWATSWLPDRFRTLIVNLATDSLEGLSALRGRQSSIIILVISTASTATSILTPYLLFLAFDLPLGIPEAALMNAVILIGSVPSSAPANVGVMQFIIIATLRQLGINNENVMLGYALVYHAVTHLPLIALGSIALGRSDWRPWSVRSAAS